VINNLARFSVLLTTALLITVAQAASPSSIALLGDRVFPENITASRDGTPSKGRGAWIGLGSTAMPFSVETIRDGFSGPTAVARIGKIAWVSEGRLSALFDPTNRDQGPKLPFRIYSVSLSAKQ
jgi:hypothetical protein